MQYNSPTRHAQQQALLCCSSSTCLHRPCPPAAGVMQVNTLTLLCHSRHQHTLLHSHPGKPTHSLGTEHRCMHMSGSRTEQDAVGGRQTGQGGGSGTCPHRCHAQTTPACRPPTRATPPLPLPVGTCAAPSQLHQGKTQHAQHAQGRWYCSMSRGSPRGLAPRSRYIQGALMEHVIPSRLWRLSPATSARWNIRVANEPSDMNITSGWLTKHQPRVLRHQPEQKAGCRSRDGAAEGLLWHVALTKTLSTTIPAPTAAVPPRHSTPPGTAHCHMRTTSAPRHIRFNRRTINMNNILGWATVAN